MPQCFRSPLMFPKRSQRIKKQNNKGCAKKCYFSSGYFWTFSSAFTPSPPGFPLRPSLIQSPLLQAPTKPPVVQPRPLNRHLIANNLIYSTEANLNRCDCVGSWSNNSPLTFLLPGIFHLQKQGGSVLIFILGLLPINLAHNVWWSLWSETRVGAAYCTSFYFSPMGKWRAGFLVEMWLK